MRALYPILFAAALVIGVAASSPGQYTGVDLAMVTACAAALAALAFALAFGVVRLVERSERTASLASALAMLAVAWFFYYVPAQTVFAAIAGRFSRDAVLLPLGAIATIAAVVWLFRQPRARLDSLSALMLRFGVLLMVLVVVQLALSHRRSRVAPQHSVLARELARPLRITAPPADRNTPRRDIYLIVLDEHPNARVMREQLQYDDAAFEDTLRALGFVIPREMQSNYTQTFLSLASLLNATQLTQLTQDEGETSRSYVLPSYLIGNNRAARFLKSQGYRYALFPSAWFPATQDSPLADVVFDAWPDHSFASETRRTELRRAVVRSTMLRRWFRTMSSDRSFDLRFMDGIRRMATDSAPTFVLAHSILSHEPYYVDASCRTLARPLEPRAIEDGQPAYRAARVAQLRCVDSLVVDVVTTLLRESRQAPVILIVGDHGTQFADPLYLLRPETVSAAFVRERFGAFGAFHLPAGGDSAFSGSVTLVNVMGHVLRYYFGADLPPSPDDRYVSGAQPYRFFRVDSAGRIVR
ncbi:MAG TPA: sulfatase-like hydrolase/transferase [Gemmatimonadaceae bacterium]|nr:sulfatase-like hydrolase/transferase [Gemmatimonadaceae bacterium]